MRRFIKLYWKNLKELKKKIFKIVIFFFILIFFINKINIYEILYDIKLKKEIIGINHYYYICNKGILLNKKKIEKVSNPKVSIIISTFNSENTLLRLLRSIQNQFFDDIEIIIIDDFSSDNSIEMIQKYQKEDPRIILIKNKKNLGTLLSRNIGILKSIGKYVIIPDSDDMLSKNILNICYEAANKYSYEIIRYNIYEGKGKFGLMNIVQKIESRKIYQPELSLYLFYGLGHLYLHEFTLWNKFIKREALIKALNNINSYYLKQFMVIFEDGLINYSLYRNSNSFFLIKNIGYFYIFNISKSIQHNPVIKSGLIKYIFLYIKLILDYSRNNKIEKDMALFLYHLYKNQFNLIYLINDNLFNENIELYKYVINFFFNYQYLNLEDKFEFIKLQKFIQQKEKSIKNNYTIINKLNKE